MTSNILTQERLKQLLYYDLDTGVFTRKDSSTRKDLIGKQAGSIQKNGYSAIHVADRKYYAHRLAWLYIYGEFPKHEIDHIDHIRTNNMISNLRAATRHENTRNISLHKRNKSGLHGVRWYARVNRWTAYIVVNKKQIHGGSYTDFFSACCARKSLENKYPFHENHGAKR